MELEETSEKLPELKRRHGLRTWKVPISIHFFHSLRRIHSHVLAQVKDKTTWYRSYADVDYNRGSNLLRSMFPSGRNSNERGDSANLAEIDPQSKKHDEAAEDGQSEGVEETSIEGERCEFPMERCLRLAPHDSDTGGFFIALLRKVKPLTGPCSG